VAPRSAPAPGTEPGQAPTPGLPPSPADVRPGAAQPTSGGDGAVIQTAPNEIVIPRRLSAPAGSTGPTAN
ncbi:MAG: hypothetical protein WCK28_14215, partial [Burkholderiales bacterium]